MEKQHSAAYILGSRYQIQQTLGTGGMSVVYLAKDLMLERPVALKILRPELSKNEDFCDKFRLEAKASAILSHPNIVTVHDFGVDRGRLYIVMEYVNGQDLKTRIKQTGKFEILKGLFIITQACAGLGYAHRAGLVHCDVKPQNMMMTAEQRLKITDFGLSRALSTINPSEKSDIVWGSPQYFSPEQASGLAPSPASDVYSVGVILYEMLTGQLPFVSEETDDLVRMHRNLSPVAPRSINSAIPEELNQIILKVLSKEPAARYRTADQLGRVISNFSKAYAAGQTQKKQGEPISTVSVNPVHKTEQATSKISSTRPVLIQSTSPEAEDVVQEFNKYDWSTIGLGLVTLLVFGGLIPFWLYIWLTLTTPSFP